MSEIEGKARYQVPSRLVRGVKTYYLTAAAIAIDPNAEDKGRKEMEMFDALRHDANLLAYRHALMANVRDEDEIKVDSALKALAKDNRVSEAILEQLKTK